MILPLASIMAEKAEFGVETLISQMLDLEFFDKNELRSIVSKIRSFEYNLQSVKKNKFNFIKYAFYLKSVISKLGQRANMKSKEFKEIQKALGRKIKHLLVTAVHRFPNELKLWFTLINFCQQMDFREGIEKAYAQMIQVHSDKEEVWALAAKWNYESNNAHEVSRNLFHRGIRHLPKSKLLWNEYFRMELNIIDIIKKRKQILQREDPIDSKITQENKNDDAILNGKVAMVVFKNAIKEIPDISFAASFIHILDQFHDLRVILKKEIFEYIEEKYPDSEEKRNLLARKHYNPLFVKTKKAKLENEMKFNKDARIEKVNQEFERTIQAFKTEKMWTFYISFNIEVYQKTKNEKRKLRCFELILKLMNKCWSLDLMPKALFVEWIYFLNQTDDYRTLDRVINYGCKKWPNNWTIWYHCLNIMIDKDSSYRDEIKRLFSRVLNNISDQLEEFKHKEEKEERLPFEQKPSKTLADIWNLYIHWASSHLQPSEVIKIIEKGCLQSSHSNNQEISATLKPLLLLKSSQLKQKGIEEARRYYHQFKNMPPYVDKFFKQMLNIELDQPKCNPNIVRTIYQDYANKLGKDNHQIWLNYCKFELEKGNPMNVGMIHFRACKMLNEEECDQFMSAYCLLQNF